MNNESYPLEVWLGRPRNLPDTRPYNSTLWRSMTEDEQALADAHATQLICGALAYAVSKPGLWRGPKVLPVEYAYNIGFPPSPRRLRAFLQGNPCREYAEKYGMDDYTAFAVRAYALLLAKFNPDEDAVRRVQEAGKPGMTPAKLLAVMQADATNALRLRLHKIFTQDDND